MDFDWSEGQLALRDRVAEFARKELNQDLAARDHNSTFSRENWDKCAEFGIQCKPGRGSHYRIGHPSQAVKLTIPAKRPIKPIYIRDLVRFIDQVRSAS